MKKLLCGFCGLLLYTTNSQAALDFEEHFVGYVNGNLTNQGPWLQTGTTGTNPIQQSDGRAVLGTTGQDAYAAFSSPVGNPDGTSFYVGLTINIASAQANGDYFFHVSNPAGTTTSFYERLFARSSGSGFQLGFLDTAGTGSTTTWGSTELSFSTDHRVVLAQNFVAGPANDTFKVYVNPADLTIEANNTAYLNHTWTSQSISETATYAAVNFRQGSSSSAATLSIDDILVSKSFVDVATAPEPSSLTLVLLAGLGVLSSSLFRRRSRK